MNRHLENVSDWFNQYMAAAPVSRAENSSSSSSRSSSSAVGRHQVRQGLPRQGPRAKAVAGPSSGSSSSSSSSRCHWLQVLTVQRSDAERPNRGCHGSPRGVDRGGLRILRRTSGPPDTA